MVGTSSATAALSIDPTSADFGQTPHYVQVTATTIMTGDTNSSNNTGYALVTFG